MPVRSGERCRALGDVEAIALIGSGAEPFGVGDLATAFVGGPVSPTG
jgi:hypothetical protein